MSNSGLGVAKVEEIKSGGGIGFKKESGLKPRVVHWAQLSLIQPAKSAQSSLAHSRLYCHANCHCCYTIHIFIAFCRRRHRCQYYHHTYQHLSIHQPPSIVVKNHRYQLPTNKQQLLLSIFDHIVPAKTQPNSPKQHITA